jgi:5-methylcytosine-specific restriction endonuclease McrA
MRNLLLKRNETELATTPTSQLVRAAPRQLARRSRYQQRAFTAAATPINVANRTEAQRLKKLRQPWQDEAWEYRDAVGELRYATTYLGNAARRMVLVPSAYVPGELNPVPLADVEDCPPQVLAAANDALDRLSAGGPVALGGMLRDVTENFEVAGECYLVGTDDGGSEQWDIRSISEVQVNADGQLILRDVETATTSGQGEPLPPNAFVSRLWWPHPRKKAYADSPFKAILDIAEELLILSRDIRAAGRSRLANNGILVIPDTLTIIRAGTEDDANDAQDGDEFFQELVAAAQAAIQDEGSASAILPLIARGPAEALQYVRQITISRQDPGNAAKRQELITRMATGIDLPAEVLTGKADLNHWTSWQVSDDTFRHHIEPIVMVEVDALTLGYYQIELQARGVPDEWLNRIVLWYDPTNLVTHPDRSQDAMNAHDRMAISDEALRDYMGFSESDAPTLDEILNRMARQARLDPTIAAQVAKEWDNNLDITGVQSNPQIQMIGPGPGEPNRPQTPVETPPEEVGGPAGLPASAREVVLELLVGGLMAERHAELGGPGSGRYPKGSGGGKTPSGGKGTKPEDEHTPVAKSGSESIGTGGRDDINRGMATSAELEQARDVAVQKYSSIPEKSPSELEAARKAAAEKHANSKRQGGDDRPNSRQRAASRQALANEFGDGTQCPCVSCGRNVGVDSTMSLDRIIPGSDGGSYARSNLVPNCYDCNRVRSNTSFAEQPWVKARMAGAQ